MRPPLIKITPPARWAPVEWAELWAHRELIRVLVTRDLVGRYRQSLLGLGWIALQPIITAVIFSFVFGRLIGISTAGAPAFVFFFSALVGWMFFSNSVTASLTSLVANANLVKKVYFPRLVLPIASVLGAAVDAAVATVVLVVAIALLWELTLSLLCLVFYVLLAAVLALGLGLWTSSLNVQYRDVGRSMQFVLQVWLYLCPVAYPLELVPENMRSVYLLNPMAVVIHGWRASALGLEQPPGMFLLIAGTTSLVLLVSGLYVFKRREPIFADVL